MKPLHRKVASNIVPRTALPQQPKCASDIDSPTDSHRPARLGLQSQRSLGRLCSERRAQLPHCDSDVRVGLGRQHAVEVQWAVDIDRSSGGARFADRVEAAEKIGGGVTAVEAVKPGAVFGLLAQGKDAGGAVAAAAAAGPVGGLFGGCLGRAGLCGFRGRWLGIGGVLACGGGEGTLRGSRGCGGPSGGYGWGEEGGQRRG